MKRRIDRGGERPLLDIASVARRGPSERVSLIVAEVAHAIRTARRSPEVVVKVSGGASTLRGAGAHLDYIGREGEQEIETDDGRRISERGFEHQILKDWDLDLEERKGARQRTITTRRKSPKLVYNVVFSMPAGTPAEMVREAVRIFARERFALRHRYLMTLHTDQPQPHVHLVVKTVSEQGERLNVRKATLREWRRDFASRLRELGVEANATERAVRGASKAHKTDGIYRAATRGESTHYTERARTVADELGRGAIRAEPGLATLTRTREVVIAGWHAMADRLDADGHREEAKVIRKFVAQMPAVRTEKQWIAEQLIRSLKRMRAKDPERAISI
jgi:hypothetical protein